MKIQETIQRWGDRAGSENKKVDHLLWVRLSFTILKQNYSSPNCPETNKEECHWKWKWVFHTTSLWLITPTQKVAWETPQIFLTKIILAFWGVAPYLLISDKVVHHTITGLLLERKLGWNLLWRHYEVCGERGQLLPWLLSRQEIVFVLYLCWLNYSLSIQKENNYHKR